MAIPQPEPSDWAKANAQQLRLGDQEVLTMLRDAYKEVNLQLAELIERQKRGELLGSGVRRAQLEQTRGLLLAKQAEVFEKLGDLVAARRLRAAARSGGLSADADRALLDFVGEGETGDILKQAALAVGQRQIDAAMARMGLIQVPLAQRIYNTSVWMNGRLGRLINSTLASGLNAREFARKARDWFNPSTPGGVRYAALRLARTEINNAFHAISVQKAAETPWVPNMQWNLSKSHPKPDICNTVAELNGGIYKSEAVPVRPHPQCMCFVTPEPIGEDAFIENFLKGDYDDFLDAELAKEDARLGIKAQAANKPKPKPKAIGLPKTQAAALAKFNNGMTRDEWHWGAGANLNAIDALIGKGVVVRDGKRGVTIHGQVVQEHTYRLAANAGATGRAVSGTNSAGAGTPKPARSFAERLVASAKEQEALSAARLAIEGRARPEEFDADMVRAIDDYTGSDYVVVNGTLRNDRGNDFAAELIARMDRAFALDKARLTRDVLAYRGIRSGDFFGDRLRGNLEGMEWEEKSFLSTTAVKDRTRHFNGGGKGILLRILLPAGTRAIEGSPLDAEAELIVDRGQRLRIVKDNGTDAQGLRHLDVELVAR